MQVESDCRQIKSIRRPLAPKNTRDHGSRPALRPNLHSKEGSVIPRAVEREILKRQSMRLKIKNQERLESVKQREMQLEDMVGVYTRINMVKGSFNYNGKPRPRYVKSILIQRISAASSFRLLADTYTCISSARTKSKLNKI